MTQENIYNIDRLLLHFIFFAPSVVCLFKWNRHLGTAGWGRIKKGQQQRYTSLIVDCESPGGRARTLLFFSILENQQTAFLTVEWREIRQDRC